MTGSKEKNSTPEATDPGLTKKKPPKEVIERMNRIITAAAEAGKTPSELADDAYRRMFEE